MPVQNGIGPKYRFEWQESWSATHCAACGDCSLAGCGFARYAAISGFGSLFDVTRVDRPLCTDYAAPMSYSHNPLHPTTLYLSAAWWVENAGHADISMSPLPADLADIERLRVTCPSSVTGPEGWIKVKTTHLGRLAVHGMHSAIPQNGMSVRSLSRDTPDLGVWLDLHTRHYTMTHLDNPVRDLSTEMAHDLFVGNDLHPAGLVAGFAASERMTGFSSLRTGQGGELELGWTGAPDRDDPAEVANLVSAVIAIADNENADTLEVEVDDTDPMLTRAIEYFEVAHSTINRWVPVDLLHSDGVRSTFRAEHH